MARKKINKKTEKKTKRIRRKRNYVAKKIAPQKKESIFKKINFAESYTSLIFGAIVVLVLGIIFIAFAKVNHMQQTSSTKDFMQIGDQDIALSNTSSTYTVRVGDDLWSIAQDFYSDGYKWIEIAKLNNIDNPGELKEGTKLFLPKTNNQLTPTPTIKQNLTPTPTELLTNSITGNTYTVIEGDCLWTIAVRAYGDGFRWIDIARENKLTNPDLIHPGNVFAIPR